MSLYPFPSARNIANRGHVLTPVLPSNHMNQTENHATFKLKKTKEPLIVVVMGVSGCGKTTVAELIAMELANNDLSAHFKDGDELHPQSNIRKMASGNALNDEDRQPWLVDVANYAKACAHEHGICVIACSALKRQYREILNTAGHVVYVFLHGSYETIAARMQQRAGHFMPQSLLDSQFAALDDPRNEPLVLTVSIEHEPDAIAANAVTLLKQHKYLVH